jgi:hypothetical protein
MCVCQFVPQPDSAAVKMMEAPRRHRCSCCRHLDRTVAESAPKQKIPGHGWNESAPSHDSSCPLAQSTPLPRLTNTASSQLVMAVGIHAADSVPLHTILLDPPAEPHSSRFPSHIGFRVLLI